MPTNFEGEGEEWRERHEVLLFPKETSKHRDSRVSGGRLGVGAVAHWIGSVKGCARPGTSTA